ncbi:hypothetical protein ACFVAJ_16560 [Agromyces sp. NPDC057679]|uniref:hypothetical protein n=1 Tax=Agromyces sp. NPDC057679 TaxID=3346207 RepID=UPI00366D8B19
MAREMLGFDGARFYYRYTCEWCEHTSRRHRSWRAPERKIRRHERRKHRGQEKPSPVIPAEYMDTSWEVREPRPVTVTIGIPKSRAELEAEWEEIRLAAEERDRIRKQQATPDASALAAARSASYLRAVKIMQRKEQEERERKDRELNEAFQAERAAAAAESGGQGEYRLAA